MAGRSYELRSFLPIRFVMTGVLAGGATPIWFCHYSTQESECTARGGHDKPERAHDELNMVGFLIRKPRNYSGT